MNGKDLFVGLGFIDERYVAEAESCGLPRSMASPWLRIASLAACLCLVLLSLWFLNPGSPGPVPPTTMPEDPLRPEGIPVVVVYVQEMTDDGFTGIITECWGPGPFEVGTELHVSITEHTMYVTDEGRLESVLAAGIDYSGCQVSVEFVAYDAESASVFAEFLSVESEATP